MKNAPGLSWGSELPFNLVRVFTECGGAWAILDCSNYPWKPFFLLPDYLSNSYFAKLFAWEIGSLLNYGSSNVSPSIRKLLDETP